MSSSQPRRLVALSFSPAAEPLLERLGQALPLAANYRPGPTGTQAQLQPIDRGDNDEGAASAQTWLAAHWPQADAVLAVGACGLVTRLVAPLLQSKERDPAVVVLDPAGRFCLPLLGGTRPAAKPFAMNWRPCWGDRP